MTHEVLARKWRPHHFDEVIGQAHVVQALRNALTQQYLHHAYLFTGTRGVGKTTLARILAKNLNCEKGISPNPCGQCDACLEIDSGRFIDLIEVDAASRTGVDDTRELLDNTQYAPTKGRYKIYLIDEVHMLSGHSFNALLKTLEEPPSHVKFLLATTDPQKLPATVLSRCLQFHLMQMTPEQIAGHTQTILKKENVEFEIPATLLIGKAADGSMRDALSLLDQSIAFGNGKVLTDEVKAMLGTIEPTSLYVILQSLQQKNANQLLESAALLSQQGADFSHALADLLSLLHQIAILQIVPNAHIDDTSAELAELAKQMSPEDAQLYYQIAIIGQRDMPFAPTPRMGFEMTLIRMMAFTPETTTQASPKVNSPIPVAKSSPATPITSNPTTTNPNNWTQLVNELNLTGAAQILAQQCSLDKIQGNTYHLHLDPKQQALYNQKYIERIEAALTYKFQKPIAVMINLTTPNSETPAESKQRLQQEQQATAEKAVYNDQSVQRIVQAFDATIIKESITPHGDLN